MGKRDEGLGEELKLYVQQIAWLSAVPKVKYSDGREERVPARIEDYRKRKADPPLPPLSSRRLFDHLMAAGPVEHGGMGPAPLGWQTIRAWRLETGTWISPREALLLRQLSAAYLAQSHAAEDALCPAPWSQALAPDQRAINEQRKREMFGAF